MRSLKLGQTKEAGSVLINETRNIIFTVIAAPQWSRATSRRARYRPCSMSPCSGSQIRCRAGEVGEAHAGKASMKEPGVALRISTPRPVGIILYVEVASEGYRIVLVDLVKPDIAEYFFGTAQFLVIILIKMRLDRHHFVTVRDPEGTRPVMVGADKHNAAESLPHGRHNSRYQHIAGTRHGIAACRIAASSRG